MKKYKLGSYSYLAILFLLVVLLTSVDKIPRNLAGPNIDLSQIDALFGYNVAPAGFWEEDGEYQGFLVDFCREVEGILGGKFNLKMFDSWSSVVDYAERSENFVVFGMARTPEREKLFRFTNSFVKIPYVIIIRDNSEPVSMDDLPRLRVATVAGYSVNDHLAEYYPDLETVLVADDLSGIRGVSTGEYDAMLINQLYGSYLIEQQGIMNIRTSATLILT